MNEKTEKAKVKDATIIPADDGSLGPTGPLGSPEDNPPLILIEYDL